MQAPATANRSNDIKRILESISIRAITGVTEYLLLVSAD